MKFILASASAVALLAAGSAASAQEWVWYDGISPYINVGVSRFEVHADTASRGGPGDVALTAGTLRGGLRFNRYFGAELEGSIGFDEEDTPIGNVDLDRQYAAYLVGVAPASNSFELLFRIGYGSTTLAVENLGESESNSINYGVGAQWFIGGGANGLRFDYTRFDNQDDGFYSNIYNGPANGDANMFTVSYVRRFGGRFVTPPPVPVPPQPLPPTPVPPTPPTPPVVQPRVFTVLFDWDRFDLTPQAQQIVREAAAYARSGNFTRINVVGHADTSGSAAYNVRLSQRRAATVRDALVAQGITGGAITTEGRGETDLARATADGVREPLNRRATIDINR